MNNNYNLTIAIPTVIGREQKFEKLYDKISNQIYINNLSDKVELIYLRDNKQISIGAKRQQLIEMSKGKFSVQIDDDDDIDENYVLIINDIIENNPDIDCIGYYEVINGMGKTDLSCFSNMWEGWEDNCVFNGTRFRFVRSPFYKNPILTSYLQLVGVKDMRFGEDKDLSKRLKESELIQNEYLLERVMYRYFYTRDPKGHNHKYGITTEKNEELEYE